MDLKEARRNIIGIIGVTLLIVNAQLYLFGKTVHMPDIILNKAYFYTQCAGVIALFIFSRRASKMIRGYIDIAIIYFSYITLSFMLKMVTHQTIITSILIVTIVFWICWIRLFYRHKKLLFS